MRDLNKLLSKVLLGLTTVLCLVLTGCEPMRYDEGAGPDLANVTWFDLFLRISGAVWVAVFVICFVIVIVLIKKNKIDVSKLGERPDDYYEKKYGKPATEETLDSEEKEEQKK